MSKIIDSYMIQFNKKREEFEEIREYTQDIIDKNLKDAGIMAIVSSRTKGIDSLREKLIIRNEEKRYKSAKDITTDIPDFIGVRISLYFPNDREKVDVIIKKFFIVVKEKEFPEEQRKNEQYNRRFPGYCATHYRVYLINQVKKLKNQIIEIQVASLLMHAWSEVEHDLIYKQKKGIVSFDEYESLDEINGLVLAGELSLQRLQRISELRITSEKHVFENHYQLASFLYEKAEKIDPNFNPFLGDVETLFMLFKKEERLTAKKVENDLLKIALYDETPISQQLIDLYADGTVNTAQFIISNKARKTHNYAQVNLENLRIGAFLRKWNSVEKQLQVLSHNQVNSKYNAFQNLHTLVTDKILTNAIFDQYIKIKQIRNKLVHDNEIPNKFKFDEYMKILEDISTFIEDK